MTILWIIIKGVFSFTIPISFSVVSALSKQNSKRLSIEFGTNVFRKLLKKQRKETNKDVIVSQQKVLYYRNCVRITVSTISVKFQQFALISFFKSKKFKMEKIKHAVCACVSLMF